MEILATIIWSVWMIGWFIYMWVGYGKVAYPGAEPGVWTDEQKAEVVVTGVEIIILSLLAMLLGLLVLGL